MITYRCQCGECTYYSSGMPPKDCQGCSKCGTTYATRPTDHKPLQPHKLKLQFDRNTGEEDGAICQECYARIRSPKSEIAEPAKDSDS